MFNSDQLQIVLEETVFKVSKGAKIRNRYNQVPHLTQDTNGKVTNSQIASTNESQEVSPFPAGDHKAHINRRIQMHSKHHKTEKTYFFVYVSSKGSGESSHTHIQCMSIGMEQTVSY